MFSPIRKPSRKTAAIASQDTGTSSGSGRRARSPRVPARPADLQHADEEVDEQRHHERRRDPDLRRVEERERDREPREHEQVEVEHPPRVAHVDERHDEEDAERDPDPGRVHRAPERARVAARHGPGHLVARPRLEDRAREVVDEHLRDLGAVAVLVDDVGDLPAPRLLQERLPGGARVLALRLLHLRQPVGDREHLLRASGCARAARRRCAPGRTRPPAMVSWVGEAAVLLPGPAVAVCAPAGAAVARAASSTASTATAHRERTVIAGAR